MRPFVVPDSRRLGVQKSMRPRAGHSCVAVALAIAAAVAACNGHLDFGAGGTGAAGGPGGASGGGAGASAGTTGRGGRGDDNGVDAGHMCPGGQAGTGSGGPACTSDADCGPSTLHCDVSGSMTCVPCTADGHCTTSGLPHCGLSLHRCVACVAATDCATGQTCASSRCVNTCETLTSPPCPTGTACEDGICHACGAETLTCSGATPWCLAPAWICVACTGDCDCSGGTPKCDPGRHVCVQCATSADCPATARFCEPTTGTCVSG